MYVVFAPQTPSLSFTSPLFFYVTYGYRFCHCEFHFCPVFLMFVSEQKKYPQPLEQSDVSFHDQQYFLFAVILPFFCCRVSLVLDSPWKFSKNNARSTSTDRYRQQPCWYSVCGDVTLLTRVLTPLLPGKFISVTTKKLVAWITTQQVLEAATTRCLYQRYIS